MATEWYRKTTWSLADQEEFEAHLKRSRGVYNKSQYLRIQAVHLQHATPPLFAEALKLIERLLSEFRDDSQVGCALLQKAECTDALYGFDAALPFYREGLAFERSHRKTRTNAWITFPWRILKEHRRDLHNEALESLRADSSMARFPIYNFRLAAALGWVFKITRPKVSRYLLLLACVAPNPAISSGCEPTSKVRPEQSALGRT